MTVGKLGKRSFAPGYWIYVGSAMANLKARLDRHLRLRKKHHWHIDYLRQVASEVRTIPIRASRRLECPIAADMACIAQPGPTGFGSSDCSCPTHLFHLPEQPLHSRAFHALLARYRMAGPRTSC